MSKKVAEQLEIVRECIAKPSKKRHTKAEEAVVEISALSEKKRTRDAAREALLEIVRTDDLELAGRAMAYSVPLLAPDDTDLIPLLRERLAINHPSDYAYMEGLLAILGSAVYPEALQIVRDLERCIGTRAAVVKSLDEISGVPFARDLFGRIIPKIRVEHYHLDELAEWEANGFTVPPIQLPTDELAVMGIALPKDYSAFLLKHRRSDSYQHGDVRWELLTAAELCEPCNVDGKEYAAVQQIKGFAQTFQECTGEKATVDSKGKPYAIERLEDGVVIGSSDSGDTLYLDPADKDSVWIYYHDGGNVEGVAKTFSSWQRKARRH